MRGWTSGDLSGGPGSPCDREAGGEEQRQGASAVAVEAAVVLK